MLAFSCKSLMYFAWYKRREPISNCFTSIPKKIVQFPCCSRLRSTSRVFSIPPFQESLDLVEFFLPLLLSFCSGLLSSVRGHHPSSQSRELLYHLIGIGNWNENRLISKLIMGIQACTKVITGLGLGNTRDMQERNKQKESKSLGRVESAQNSLPCSKSFIYQIGEELLFTMFKISFSVYVGLFTFSWINYYL